MGFIPTGPYTVTLAVLVVLASLACFRAGGVEGRQLGLALLTSLFFARLGTWAGDPMINAAGLIAAALISLYGRTVLCKTISALYGFRIMVAGLPFAGIASFDVMAEITNLILILQLVVVYGGTLRGNPIASPANIVGYRNGRMARLARVFARRLDR